MAFSPLIDELIKAFRCLPGVGTKSAQRMAFHVLERNPEGGQRLAGVLSDAIEKVGHCAQCRTLTELEICTLCQSDKRDETILCIVETPADVLAVEQAGHFRGYYFVLLGHLSPIDGMGPDEIGIPALVERVVDSAINEIIIATNPTVEGEATAHYIAEQFKGQSLQISRIAHGVPVGGELEYVDGGTLAHAFAGRKSLI